MLSVHLCQQHQARFRRGPVPQELPFLLHRHRDLLRFPHQIAALPGGGLHVSYQHLRVALLRTADEAGVPIFQQNRLFLMIHSIFALFLYCSSYPKERI